LCKWAVKKKVLQCLNILRACRARSSRRIEVLNTCPERQGVEEELVPDFALLRKGRRAPHPPPDIPRRICEARDGAAVPVQSPIDSVLLVEKTPSRSRCKIWKRCISCKETRTRGKARRSRGRGRKGLGEERLDELSAESMGGPKFVDGSPDAGPIRARARRTDHITRNQLKARSRSVKGKEICNQQPRGEGGGECLRNRKRQNVFSGPLGEIRIGRSSRTLHNTKFLGLDATFS
jgi:hypothetical protein